MYLRTNCDRELYFSLFKSNKPADLIATGMPAPLSARPNIQLVTAAGVEFEEQEYTMLLTLLGSSQVHFTSKGTAKFSDLDLDKTLRGLTSIPAFCLQPAINPQTFRNELLHDDFGLDVTEAAMIPELSGMRPDIIIVRSRGDLQWEVMPNGKRKKLTATDSRIALSVVDVKNTAEGNKSYAAEVVLYSIVLAKWLAMKGMQANYFVSDECFLWTHNEKSAITALPATATIDDKVNAVLTTLEKVEFAVIAPSVVKFFTEDLLRVINKANAEGWQAIDYHVGPLCSNCDWLGYERWLSTADSLVFKANEGWYCKPAAKASDHLSQVPQMSKGARQVLEGSGITTLANLGAIAPSAAVLKTHSFLKREKLQIASRAQAILTSVPSIDNTAALAGLAKDVDLFVSIAVNFDASAGLLTGIAARGTLFMPYGATNPIRQLGNFGAAVEEDNLASEWNTLYAFLTNLERIIKDAQNQFGSMPRTQIYFWEQRQFQELCAAVGRHLTTILTPIKGSLLQAMAWLFPPDELMKRDSAVSPHIVFIGDIARRVLRTTTPHAFTLWSTFEDYHYPSLKPPFIDKYYIDPFGNGIPRERIFEVWKNNGTVRSGGVVKTKSQAAEEYARALKAQSLGISSIAAKLRNDFKALLKGSAKQLNIGVLGGATRVAFDSKLWIKWAEVSAISAAMERKAEFTLPAESLEASYKALVLTTFIGRTVDGDYEYDVSPESSEAKLDDVGSHFVMGSTTAPGLPLEKPRNLGLAFDIDFGAAYELSLCWLLRVQIVELDREQLKVTIRILPQNTNSNEQQAVVNALVTGGHLPLAGGLFLMEGMPYNESASVEETLKAVGSPAFATPDTAAVRAMGKTTGTAPSTSPATPASRVLWQADMLHNTVVRNPTQTVTLAARAKHFSVVISADDELDLSQVKAINDLSRNQLSLVWGPPGTGKTSTLVAYLLAVIEESILKGEARKILLTGPNYRAVEVLMHKLLEKLNKLPALSVDLFMVYSRSRPVVGLPEPGEFHLNAQAVSLGEQAAVDDLAVAFDNLGVSIFGTSAHTTVKLAKAVTGLDMPLIEAFDLVIIDESSQVPLTLALNPLATLKQRAELVIAGDPKQMPPIQVLAPPSGAEHLVGSIHGYLQTRFGITEQELLVNYRSGEDLVEYALTLDYPSGLVAKFPDRKIQLLTPVASLTLPPGLPVSDAWAELLAPEKVVTALLHEDTQSSQANITEARMVATLAYALRHCAAQELAPLASGATPTSFTDEEFFRVGLGVVTPHKAQRALVLAELARLFPAVTYDKIQEAVDTVERFQGGQRHTIIVSYGVGDVDVIQGEEEFLLQMERTNVAVSRAMAKCIVIMPKSLAYHLPSDNKVSKTASALKSYLEEFCSNRATHAVAAATTPVEIRWK
jgi:hypothetical protein